MNILGISCYYHDSAASLLKDGRIIAAASEERFNRHKSSSDFPVHAINFCLQAGDITAYDLDYVAFYEKPYLKFSRVISNHIRTYPFSLKNFLCTMPLWLQDRLILPLVLKRELGFKGETVFIKHHLSHAASAFLVSPFRNAAILTADGVGEWATATLGFGKENDIKILKEIYFPDSLGLFYTALTTYLGFKALEGEGIVMGLAGYGQPVYVDKLKQTIRIKPDGSFTLDQRFFGFFNEGSKMYTSRFIKTFGRERRPQEELTQRHCDMAASLQRLTEEILIRMVNNIYQETKIDKLCLAGGLFLNCVANHKIMENSPFSEVFIQPAAGDSGGALGAASYLYHGLLGNPRDHVMEDAYLGPQFSANQIRKILISKELNFKELNEEALVKEIAEKIRCNKIVGWFQGKMEFGPRALGNRSLLANPCHCGMKDMLNSKVKNRESFRPYAPAVLEERVNDFFIAKQFSPFMLLAATVKEDKKKIIPAVTHVDGTARVQIVHRKTNPRFWKLIKEFENITGIPMVINTSFNLKGEPMVCSPQDALNDFLKSEMDVLVLDNFVLEK